MIVPSMTIHEIHKEVFDDIKNLETKIDEYCMVFKKVVLKSSRYPLSRLYSYKTAKKNNLFFIGLIALKRSNWKKPIVYVYGIYARPEGNYAVAPTLDTNICSIYPPHFFKRYRERIVEDKSLSNEEIISLYFKNDWGFMGAVVNKDFESVYHCFEDDNKEDKVSFVGATSQGYCFGEKQGNVNIVKTIISEEMLFENQKALFRNLRKSFDEVNKVRYGYSFN